METISSRRVPVVAGGLLVHAWLAATALAWAPVAPGIEYQEFYLPDPNVVYVARMDRHNTQCYIDSGIANNRINGTAQTPPSQAALFDDAVNYWGQDWGHRNDVIVTINGDYWDTSDYLPLSGQTMTGWGIKNVGSAAYFGWTQARLPGAGVGALSNMRVRYAGGASQTIDDINVPRTADQLILYTNHYAAVTPANTTGLEVLVEMTRPVGSVRSGDAVVGYVRAIRPNQGSTKIPFDHVVLSAAGTAATTLQNNVAPGDRISISMAFYTYGQDWSNLYAAVGGLFLLSSVESSGAQAVPMGGLVAPRTASAYNDDYVYFVVVDGRSATSIGMDFSELAYFCRTTLGAKFAISHDGGGSSCMVVNGVVKNDPSDGHPRSVPNTLMMCINQPKVQSTSFKSGDTVKATGTTTLYSGPGSNFLSFGSVASNTTGTLLDHSLRGVYAKGYPYWNVDFSGTTGWVRESNLTRTAASNLPVITAHPADVTACPTTGEAVFFVSANGTGVLRYQWQHHGVDLAEGGHFSGVNTPVLTITHIADEDAGSYRCVITDDNGSITSYSAALVLKAHTVIKKHPAPAEAYPLGSPNSATFSVVAVGEGTVTYQWQKGTTDLTDDGHYAGSTTSTLTLNNVDSRDRGDYRCRVSALCETVYSNSATLSVISADLDGDGDGDMDDFAQFQNCLGVSEPKINAPDCVKADMNGDGLIKAISDREPFRDCMTGPDIPLRPGC